MEKELSEKINELIECPKDEAWYITKQNLNFIKLAVLGLESIKQYNNKKDEMSFGDFYDQYIVKKPNYRAIRGLYYYGLINQSSIKNTITTEVASTFQHSLVKIKNIVNQQVEKLRIPVMEDKNKNREKFNIFIVPTFYAILLDLIDENKKDPSFSPNLTKNEFRIFVITIKKFEDYKMAVKCIKQFRNLPDNSSYKQYILNKLKDKFDVRINILFEQLSFIHYDSEYYSIESTSIKEIRNKVSDYKNNINYYENMDEDEYLNLLQSNVSLWNINNESNVKLLTGGFNKIFSGAPGTGKSFYLDKSIENDYPKGSQDYNQYVFRTTFYPDYSYYDFIGDLKPSKVNDSISYEFKAGIFTRALTRALEHPDKKIYLVIEEMSRGNSEAIFGDVFQLLDRDHNGKSVYQIDNENIYNYIFRKNKNLLSGNKIYIPSNMYILGTVNSSDQNVYVLDTAFKRRFQFKIFSPRPNTSKNNFKFEVNGTPFEWLYFYQALNYFIIHYLDLEEDKQIGQWFVKDVGSKNLNNITIKNKLLHYLWEDINKLTFASDKNHSIFNKDYKTFYDIYDDFDNKNKKIFNDKIIELYNDYKSKGNINGK